MQVNASGGTLDFTDYDFNICLIDRWIRRKAATPQDAVWGVLAARYVWEVDAGVSVWVPGCGASQIFRWGSGRSIR